MSGSKILNFILLAVVLVLAFILLRNDAPKEEKEVPEEKVATPITITHEEVDEENFTGTKPVIVGESLLARTSRDFIEKVFADFKKQADEDVPKMRAEFGPDLPMATYMLEVKAEHLSSDDTDSIVISEYIYTGGANGNSVYKVFTASKTSGKILSLSEVVDTGKQKAFTDLVKAKLLAWKPSGSEGPVVFTEEVEKLTFDSFKEWSKDEENLILYFSKYEIAPGVVGAFAFPIPLREIEALK